MNEFRIADHRAPTCEAIRGKKLLLSITHGCSADRTIGVISGDPYDPSNGTARFPESAFLDAPPLSLSDHGWIPEEPTVVTGFGLVQVSSIIEELQPDAGVRDRLVPSFLNGRPQGFKLMSLSDRNPLRWLGLRHGDTLLAINEHPVASDAWQRGDFKLRDLRSALRAKLDGAASFVVSLKRRGQQKEFEFQILR